MGNLSIFALALALSQTVFADLQKSPVDYWNDTPMSAKDVKKFLNNTNCYKEPKLFVACIEGLNTLANASVDRKVDGKAVVLYDPQYIATHPGKVGVPGEKIGSLQLGEIQKRSEFTKLSKSTQLHYSKVRRQEYESVVWSIYDSKNRVDFDGTVDLLVGKIKDSKETKFWMGSAINSYFEVAMDPHTDLMPTEMFKDMMSPPKAFAGIGAQVQADDKGALIAGFVDETSSGLQAGLKEGDVIVKIDGQPLAGLKLDQIIGKLRGTPDTTIAVTVLRGSQEVELKVQRRSVNVKNVSEKIVKDMGVNFGYIKIGSFVQNTCTDVVVSIQKLVADTNGQISGLILDLRNNGGGLVSEGDCLARLFVGNDKTTAVLKNVKTGEEEDYGQFDLDRMLNPRVQEFLRERVPLVVLINGGSASASEIVAGTLQDYKRAFLVGERSYGKGTAQNVSGTPSDIKELIGIDGKGYIYKYTENRFYLPGGTSNQIIGLTPEVEVAFKPDATDDERVVPREEDMYTSALSRVTDSRPNTRFKETNAVLVCMEKGKMSDTAYAKQKAAGARADYQLIKSQEALGCAIMAGVSGVKED